MQKNVVTSEEVYRDLKKRIIQLEFMPGERISENELSNQYGVSRHIVRTAIARLKDNGFVDVYPQRGTFVSLIDLKYVKMVLFCRESMESEALRRLLKLPEEKIDQVVQDMKENLESQKLMIEKGTTMDEFYPMDKAFHRIFMYAVGRDEAMDLIHEQNMHVRRWRNFELQRMRRLTDMYKKHAELADTIEKRDLEAGLRVIHDHLNTVEQCQEQYVQTDPQCFIIRE